MRTVIGTEYEIPVRVTRVDGSVIEETGKARWDGEKWLVEWEPFTLNDGESFSYDLTPIYRDFT